MTETKYDLPGSWLRENYIRNVPSVPKVWEPGDLVVGFYCLSLRTGLFVVKVKEKIRYSPRWSNEYKGDEYEYEILAGPEFGIKLLLKPGSASYLSAEKVTEDQARFFAIFCSVMKGF